MVCRGLLIVSLRVTGKRSISEIPPTIKLPGELYHDSFCLVPSQKDTRNMQCHSRIGGYRKTAVRSICGSLLYDRS